MIRMRTTLRQKYFLLDPRYVQRSANAKTVIFCKNCHTLQKLLYFKSKSLFKAFMRTKKKLSQKNTLKFIQINFHDRKIENSM